MKIIKPGKRIAFTVLEATCPHCQCVFEEMLAAWDKHEDSRDGDYYSIDCPNGDCRRLVTLTADLAKARMREGKPAEHQVQTYPL